jgi:hypothetical protein
VVPIGDGRAEVGAMEARTAAKLEAAGRLDTIEGEAALYLARQIDAGGHSGSQAAALVRQLLEASAKALAGVKSADDAVDELRRRRMAKVAGA